MKNIFLGEGFGVRKNVMNNTIALYRGVGNIPTQNELIVHYFDDGLYVCTAYPNYELENILQKKYEFKLVARKKMFLIPDEVLNTHYHEFLFTNLNLMYYATTGRSGVVWNNAVEAMGANPFIGFSKEYLDCSRIIFDIFSNFCDIEKVNLYNRNKCFAISFLPEDDSLLETVIGICRATLNVTFNFKKEKDLVIAEFDISHLGVGYGTNSEYNETWEN